VKTLIRATTTAASAALATLLTIGAPSMSAAATFVYVSDAEDATIDAYLMDTKTGALTSIGKTEAGKTVMPMAVSPNKKFLYAVVRSQPTRVLTYAIDGKTGALTQKATAPLPDSMPYVSTDRSGRFLFTASYGNGLFGSSNYRSPLLAEQWLGWRNCFRKWNALSDLNFCYLI
jgi:6-phosphogluconolactonase